MFQQFIGMTSGQYFFCSMLIRIRNWKSFKSISGFNYQFVTFWHFCWLIGVVIWSQTNFCIGSMNVNLSPLHATYITLHTNICLQSNKYSNINLSSRHNVKFVLPFFCRSSMSNPHYIRLHKKNKQKPNSNQSLNEMKILHTKRL